MTDEKSLILATTSPHRIEAFNMLGIPFRTIGSDVDEYSDDRPTDPEHLVIHLAKLKARAVAEKQSGDVVVIGFDSVGCFNNVILEKPKSEEDAFERLKSLSGKSYEFYTGINVIDVKTSRTLSRVVRTDIQMRKFSEREVRYYLDRDDRYKTCAQGYDPLNTYGATFIERISGSYNNPLRGIPLEVVVEMLKNFGIAV